MLVVFQRRGLTGRSAHDDRVRVVPDLVLDEVAQHFVIDLSVLFHGRCQRYARSCKNRHILFFPPAISIHIQYFQADSVNSAASADPHDIPYTCPPVRTADAFFTSRSRG